MGTKPVGTVIPAVIIVICCASPLAPSNRVVMLDEIFLRR